MNKKTIFLFIKKNTFHSNYAITKNSVHMESISGPFDEKMIVFTKYLRTYLQLRLTEKGLKPNLLACLSFITCNLSFFRLIILQDGLIYF